jgi:hypothetical protein
MRRGMFLCGGKPGACTLYPHNLRLRPLAGAPWQTTYPL